MTDKSKIPPEVMKTLTAAPLPNFHQMWQQYADSDFRRQWLQAWAGDDPERQRVVQELLMPEH